MRQHAVVLKAGGNVIQLLVVGKVVRLLAATLLKLARPKLKVSHLMDGKQREVKLVLVLVPQGIELRYRVRLYAKLQAGLDGDAIRPTLTQVGDAREVCVVVNIYHTLALHHLGRERILPVRLDAVVHVIGKADLVKVVLPSILHNLLGNVPRVIREHAMNVIVGKHGNPFWKRRRVTQLIIQKLL